MFGRPLLVSLIACLCCLCAANASTLGRYGLPQDGQQGRSLLAGGMCQPWEKTGPIEPAVFTTNPVIDLQWVDKADKEVFAITKKRGIDTGGLWHSSDGGEHWEDKTAMLYGSMPQTEEALSESVDILNIFTPPGNPKDVVLLGTGSFLWVSSDAGATLTARRLPGGLKGAYIRSLKIHPRRNDWLMMLAKRPGCTALSHVSMQCPFDLMVTQNLYSGEPTWTNLTANANGKVAGFVDFDWGANICPDNECGNKLVTKDENVLATYYANPGDYDMPWDPDVNFIVSDNFFKDFSIHVKCGNQFEVVGRTVYLAFANSCPTDVNGKPLKEPSKFPGGITLFTSTDGGNTFVQACLPIALKQEGYELMETQDGTGVVIVVDYLVKTSIMDIPASSVFMSGPHHALFSLSLADVYHADFGLATDFSKIEGLPGLFIANQMRSKSGKPDDFDIADLLGFPLVETRISFNGGGQWENLQAPTKFNNPSCNKCDNNRECFLHLHGSSSWDSLLTSVPSVYTSASAPGVIMSSGNVGPRGVGLDDNDGLCTWLSTDGGMTWKDVAVGTYIYEYADFGGLLIMAKHPGASDTPTDKVLFSWDQGGCWQDVSLTEALFVDNIRIEPDGQQPRVLVHGRRCTRDLLVPTSEKCGYKDAAEAMGVNEGVIYVIDVPELLPGMLGTCEVPPDFQEWGVPESPEKPNSVKCILGRKTTFQRRKPQAMCYYGADYKRPAPKVTPCTCTELDTACDYGYWKNADGQCVAVPSTSMPTCPTLEEHQYQVSSSGLRVLHDDQCVGLDKVIKDTDGKGHALSPSGGGDKPKPAPAPSGGGGKGGDSPSPSPSGSKKGTSGAFKFLIFLLVAVFLTLLFALWWIYLATEVQRDMVRDVCAAGVAGVRNAWFWLIEQVGMLRGRFGGGSSAPMEQDLGYFQPLGDANDAQAMQPRA